MKGGKVQGSTHPDIASSPGNKLEGVKTLILLLCAAVVAWGQLRHGDFTIRVDPTAVVQAATEIPFEIRVTDTLHKPVLGATVTLQIETENRHADVRLFKATGTKPGIYIAKPNFPKAGDWSVYVQVRRGNDISARTFQYTVPSSVSP